MKSGEIRDAVARGMTALAGIRMGMTMVNTETAVNMLAVEFRRELFRLHRELGSILGTLENEEHNVPPVTIP